MIARYGGSWRGIKPKVASEHGAVGALIYSDPRDDGLRWATCFRRAVPPEDGVQRGSVMDMPTLPWRSLTPGRRRVEGREATVVADAPTLTKIPVLPISYGDAEPLLAALDRTGRAAPWRGGLPITYRIGPGPARCT